MRLRGVLEPASDLGGSQSRSERVKLTKMTDRIDAELSGTYSAIGHPLSAKKRTYAVIAPLLTAYSMMRLTLLLEDLRMYPSAEALWWERYTNTLLPGVPAAGKVERQSERHQDVHQCRCSQAAAYSDLHA